MSDDGRPGGTKDAWVDRDHGAAQNAFDRSDGYSGQDYSREREEAQGKADQADDTPHERTLPDDPPPEDPNDFKVPGSSGPRKLP